jgi:undecaprenyl-diphosphatase
MADKIEEILLNSYVVAAALIIGGIVLIIIEKYQKTIKYDSVVSLTYRTAVCIGFIQCLAMIPGTSRSAATILGAMALGASRAAAAEFSFFLAVPTMIGASFYSLYKSGFNLTAQQWQVLGVGFIVSFLVAWVVVAFFMNYIRKNNFKPFAYYRIVLGLLVFAYFLLKHSPA